MKFKHRNPTGRPDIEGYLSYSQDGEDVVLRSMLGERPGGFYIDIGALHPTRFSNTKLFYDAGWQGINIEPSPRGCETFSQQRQRDINLNLGVSSASGTLQFYAFDEPALNTFDKVRAETLEKTTRYRIRERMNVKVSRLDEIITEYAPNKYIDFMNIDVEHHEMSVLESNDWEKYRPEVLLVEILDFKLETLFENPIHKFLTSRDYRFECKTPRTCFYINTRASSELAPILLFAYNRPHHTEQTLLNLLRNNESARSDLYVFCDGPKSNKDLESVSAVHDLVSKITGFKNVTVIKRSENLGLANSIIDGVTSVLNKHNSAIVLEDDIVVAPNFLRYMNAALHHYEPYHHVASIHGWNFSLTDTELPDAFFLRGADCWGWATWKRAWSKFEPNGSKLLRELKLRKQTHTFDLDGAYPYTQMLEDQIAGKNNSWAIRWHASAFLNDMLTLHPGESLVMNIGLDGSGVHSQPDEKMVTTLSSKRDHIYPESITQDERMRGLIIQHLKSDRIAWYRVAIRRAKTLIRNLLGTTRIFGVKK